MDIEFRHVNDREWKQEEGQSGTKTFNKCSLEMEYPITSSFHPCLTFELIEEYENRWKSNSSLLLEKTILKNLNYSYRKAERGNRFLQSALVCSAGIP